MSQLDEKVLTGPEEHLLIEPPAEEKLRREIEDLRRQVQDLRHENGKRHSGNSQHGGQNWRPGPGTLWVLAVAVLTVLVGAIVLGWIPRRNREQRLQRMSHQEQTALPRLNFVLPQRSAPFDELILPGTTEALADAPVLARADGYVARRLADIGDHVRKGQVLAVIAAPDLDQQVVQARAQVSQSEAALRQANANLAQGRANEALAGVTAARYRNLVTRGAVSRQDNDVQQATWQAQVSNLESLNQAISVSNENLAASRANLQRLLELQSFERVTAPFDGVVTLRNTDTGALITNGSTLLFRIAQIDRLRTYISVPQPNAPSVQVGEEARLTSPELAKPVVGRVTRSAEALDPATRTLLTEVQVSNAGGSLRPGMFVEVELKSARPRQPLLIPGDAVIANASGTQVAVIGDDGIIHIRQVSIGRDYGAATEIYAGLADNDHVVVNPNDAVREGVKAQGTLTKANLDVQSGAQRGAQQNANSEKLQPVQGGAQPARRPSVTKKSRGPGY